MAANVFSSKRYSFTLLIELLGLWIATIGPVTDAREDVRNILVTGFEDVIIPRQLDEKLMKEVPNNLISPFNFANLLKDAVVNAKRVLDNDIFKSSEFLDLQNAFKEQRKAYLGRYGKDGAHLIYWEGRGLAPSRLAVLAHLCKTQLDSIKAMPVLLFVPCATDNYPNAQIGVSTTYIDAAREGAIPLEDTQFIEAYKLSNVRTSWRRVLYTSLVILSAKTDNTPKMNVFSIGSKIEDVITLRNFDSHDGYAQEKIVDIILTDNSKLNFKLGAMAKKKNNKFVVSDTVPEVTVATHAVIITGNRHSDYNKALKELAELTRRSTELLFKTDSPTELQKAKIDGSWERKGAQSDETTSASVPTISGRLLGMWSVCIVVLNSSGL